MAKTAKAGGTGLKYSDKSGAQPELVPIFNKIAAVLRSHASGVLTIKGGEGGQIVLSSDKPVVIDGRKKTELWLASALIQKGYVGFYYMPVYMSEVVRHRMGAELMKTLKGKACFHIKKDDPVVFEQIKEALRIGVEAYRTKGWL
jgi:frataxin-like iron-binding protein CyaY